MQAYFDKCSEKLGFVPNVLQAYSFDVPKLETFVALYNDLMLAPSGLSKLEREMIAVAVSSANRCYYCLVAHGAAVRTLSGDPVLGELMNMNYRAARLSKRHRAMLDFAVKLTTELVEDRGGRSRSVAPRRLFQSRHLGHRGGRRLLQHDQPRRVGNRYEAEQRLPRAGALSRAEPQSTLMLFLRTTSPQRACSARTNVSYRSGGPPIGTAPWRASASLMSDN